MMVKKNLFIYALDLLTHIVYGTYAHGMGLIRTQGVSEDTQLVDFFVLIETRLVLKNARHELISLTDNFS